MSLHTSPPGCMIVFKASSLSGVFSPMLRNAGLAADSPCAANRDLARPLHWDEGCSRRVAEPGKHLRSSGPFFPPPPPPRKDKRLVQRLRARSVRGWDETCCGRIATKKAQPHLRFTQNATFPWFPNVISHFDRIPEL